MRAGAGVRLRVELLGPLRLLVDDSPVEVVGAKRRAVLALLAFAEGAHVTTDQLVEALWPLDGPDRGRSALHNHVSRLRRQLGAAADRLQTGPAGYRLELGPDELDVARARTLLVAAKANARHDPARSYGLLRQAYGLWQGPVLADLVEFPAIGVAVGSSERLRRDVGDALIDAAVAAGEAAAVVEIAQRSFLDDPLREAAAHLLMRVLAALGRAPEALAIAAEFRRRLADETGLDPSPALGELVRAIAAGSGGPPLPRSPRVGAGRLTLIGRDTSVAALHRLLATERLVTVVGPGGVGKTRVALEVARRTEPATVLLLAPLTDPAAIPHALAAALDLTAVQGDVLAAAMAVLAERSGLLLIDNCEHLLGPTRDLVEAVLAACPQVTVLATSREPLGLPVEYVSRLAPLTLPAADDDLARVASVALFVERAARVRPQGAPNQAELPVVADVVRRLDGMPLAIELAAGRLSTFSLEDLRDRLDRALDLLGRDGGGGDRRHGTLRATVEWSYALLTDDEQRLFRHLSVFVDGVDIETVERVGSELGLTNDPGRVLARLVDASMVVADLTGRPRYRMLHLLRAFGEDRLAATGEQDAAVERLLRWAVDLTAAVERDLLTDREPVADATVRRELPNLRYAWQQARRRGSLDTAAAMIAALHDVVTYRDLVEINEWAAELADDPAIETSPLAAFVLGTAAEAAYHRGDYARADTLAHRGLELAVDDAGRWRCLMTLSVVDLARAEHDACVAHVLAAADVGRLVREEPGIAALAHAYRGNFEDARALNARGIAGASSPTMRSWGAYVAGEIDNFAGFPERAEQHYLRAIELARRSGATFLVGVASLGLITVRAAAGHVDEALAGFREVIDYFARNCDWTHQWVVLRNLAELLRRVDDPEPAAQLDAAADRAAEGKAVAADRSTALEVARRAIERHQRRPAVVAEPA